MKATTKEKILESGADIVLQKGFNHTGIQELLKAADIPKGSFYFYFDSKEKFGIELIDYYSRFISENMTEYIRKNGATSALEQLKLMFEWSFKVMSLNDYKGGCPIGNLSLEMADINENFRIKLNETITDTRRQIKIFLEKAKDEGTLDASADVDTLSDFLFSSWEGSLMLMKVTKTTTPQNAFFNMVFNKVLT
jgi:TetR/AcrR family transcriptional regulator, transcriptional repressor for nem operon